MSTRIEASYHLETDADPQKAAALIAGESGKPLVVALADWRESTKGDVSPDTYRVRKELVEKVREVVASSAPVASLPLALRTLRATKSTAGCASSSFSARSAARRRASGRDRGMVPASSSA